MTPLYANHFAGHLFTDDPRTPVTAAAGCTWPTFPAHRYILTAPNAAGMLAPLRTQGVLFEKVTPGSAHNECQYNMISGPLPVVFGIAWKRWDPATEGYEWEISISVSSPCGLMTWTVPRPPETCNRDIGLYPLACPGVPEAGNTGSPTDWLQVEFDSDGTDRYP